MADNITTKKRPTPAKRAAAARSTAARKTASARAAGRRSSAKSPAAETARPNVAERAALVYVGATLEARDRAAALMTDLREATTIRGAGQRISKLERRGSSARTQLERDVRKARARVAGIASSAKERVTALA